MARQEIRLAKGVYARTGDGPTTLFVVFNYRGVRCRETIPHLDGTKKSDINTAKHLLGAVHSAIARDCFDFQEFFPHSNTRASKLFGRPSSKVTIRDIGDAWLADKAISLEGTTNVPYRGAMLRFVYPAIGDKRVVDVTVEDIRKMFREADIRLKTARNYRIPLNAIFKRALADGIIDANPLDRIEIKEFIALDKQDSEDNADPLSEQEIETFLRVCRKIEPEWINYWTVAFYTGLRPGEMRGLEWDDWQEDKLRVKRSVVMRQDKGTKTKSSRRTVDLTDLPLQALKAQQLMTRFNKRIFWCPRSKMPLKYDETANSVFKRICTKAGIRRRNQGQTRHSYASNMLVSGVQPMYVAKQMGHSSKNGVQTLNKHYGRWIENAPVQVTFGTVKSKAVK